MVPLLRRALSVPTLRALSLIALAALTTYGFLLPGLSVVRDVRDPAISGPGIPVRAVELHRSLTPRFEVWARARVASGRAREAPLHDVPTTEWPMFTAVYYLMATQAIEEAWQSGQRPGGAAPMTYSAGAVDAARALLVDPGHHTWVRTHWGDGYLHRKNVFFRSLLIAGLTSHEALTRDGRVVPMLRDQVETLVATLDGSPLGLEEDYPGECYPIDVLAAVGFIRRADRVLGTDHAAFVARELRAFQGARTDRLGLVPYRVNLPSAALVQPSRGIGNSWVLQFAPDLWSDRAAGWYVTYERHFWQDRGWASGFREYARGTEDAEWTFEIDAGPVLDGFGTSATAFGLGAARRNGRFDHAATLAAQLSAASWPLPDGTLLLPRALSHAADAPYLGEAGILYFLTVQPAPGVPVVRGGRVTPLVWGPLALYFGVSAFVLVAVLLAARRLRAAPWGTPLHPAVIGAWGAALMGAAIAWHTGHGVVAAGLAVVAIGVPFVVRLTPPMSAGRLATDSCTA